MDHLTHTHTSHHTAVREEADFLVEMLCNKLLSSSHSLKCVFRYEEQRGGSLCIIEEIFFAAFDCTHTHTPLPMTFRE